MREEHYLLKFFSYEHLPEHLKLRSMFFHHIAHGLWAISDDNPETSTALRKLLEAKDCAVRSVLFDKQP